MHIQQDLQKNCKEEIIMKQEELEKELKDEKLNYMYLLYGEETYLLETAVKKIKKLFGEKIVRHKLYRIRRRNNRKSYARNSDAMFWL